MGRVAVLSHGMLSTKDSNKHKMLSERLVEMGYSVFRFDFTGQGESEGDPTVITYSNEVDDLISAIDLLQSRGASRFCLLGSSMGSGVSILVAARIPDRIAGMALLASVVHSNMIWEAMKAEDRESWREKGIFDFNGRKLSYETVEDGKNHDVAGSLSAFAGPVLFVHGSGDELIDYRLVEELSRSHGRNTGFHLVQGADHRFSEEKQRNEAIDVLCRWIGDRLS